MRWAVPIIVVALAACILAGSLGFQDTIRQTTEYDTVLSDLAPVADAGPVSESVQYNPLTNVTGWGSSVTYESQSAASLYKLATDMTIETRTSNALGTMGPYMNAPVEPYYLNEWTWSDGSDVGNTAPAGAIGGWSGSINQAYDQISYHFNSNIRADIFLYVDESEDPPLEQWAICNYAKQIDGTILPDQSIVTLTDYGQDENLHPGLFIRTRAPGNYSYTRTTYETQDPIHGHIRETITWSLGEYVYGSGDYYLSGGNWYKITGYDGGAPVVDYSSTYTICLLSNDPSTTFSYKVITNATILYIKPYTPVTVGEGSATWANGYDNDRVQILADAAGLSYSVNGGAPPAPPVTGTAAAGGGWISGPYPGMILLTLNADGTAYWQGVTSYSTTKDFTIAEYRYELPASAAAPIRSVTLYYDTGSGGGRAAVTDTWVPQDSKGILWNDATFPIDTIFPQLWAGDNIRVKFNSFVATGDGLTVNGVTYPVTDGSVTVDGDTFKLAGSALEWTPEGDTALVAPNGDRYDLGTRSGTFTLNGVWYGVLSMDTFEVVNVPAKEAVFGIFPAVEWLAWVFVGVLAVGTVGVLATGRQLDIMDILALGLCGVVGVIVAVTT